MKAGKRDDERAGAAERALAAMEPGHEGREELASRRSIISRSFSPQWSPAMKAGKRHGGRLSDDHGQRAAMEPGHEGREELPSMRETMANLGRRNGARP